MKNGAYGFSPNNSDLPYVSAQLTHNSAFHNGYKGTGHGLGYGFIVWDHTANAPSTDELFANNLSYDNEFAEVYIRDEYTHTNNSWDLPVDISDDDFISLDWTEMLQPRKSDGSLPDISFLKLKEGSKLIDAGIDLGLPFTGDGPDLGAFEFNSE